MTRAADSSTPGAGPSGPCPRSSSRPLAGANGLGDLEHELRFAQSFSGIGGLRLVHGTKKFSPVP